MKKYLSIGLAVVAVVLSIISVVLNVRTMKKVESLEASLGLVTAVTEEVEQAVQDAGSNGEEVTVDFDKLIEEAMAKYEENKQTEEATLEESTEGNTDENSEENSSKETVEEDKYVFSITNDQRVEYLQNQKDEYAGLEYLYTQEHTLENAYKINALDKMLIANNTVDFTNKSIAFIGDSITVGVGSTQDADGNYTSYVKYVEDALHVGNCINNATAGWLYSTAAGEEYSIVANMETKISIGADILVFFAGVNDYLTASPDKRFGTYSETTKSTAGFCGSFEQLCDFVNRYLSDKEVFIVLTYPITAEAGGTYTNADTESHTWYDYMQAERVIATRYGLNVIDLYSTGLLDGTVTDLRNTFQDDDIHPNDVGYKVIGEHIAAQMSYILGNS